MRGYVKRVSDGKILYKVDLPDYYVVNSRRVKQKLNLNPGEEFISHENLDEIEVYIPPNPLVKSVEERVKEIVLTMKSESLI